MEIKILMKPLIYYTYINGYISHNSGVVHLET
jgi:hypothetical protein